MNQGIVCLEAGETKDDEVRTDNLNSKLKENIDKQLKNNKNSKYFLPYVFVNRTEKDRIKRFDKAWKKACKDMKIGIKLFHDFRRTAVRNMVRSGIPERVAMMISGHKTRSVFGRYNILSDTDLKLVAQRQAEYLDFQKVINSVTIHQFGEKRSGGL